MVHIPRPVSKLSCSPLPSSELAHAVATHSLTHLVLLSPEAPENHLFGKEDIH